MGTHGFPEGNITRLSDEDGSGFTLPTRTEILNALRRMISEAVKGDTLVFMFTGHGINLEGHQYVKCHDFQYKRNAGYTPEDGYIHGKEFGQILSRAKTGVTILVFMDACHSGTMMTLKCKWDTRSGTWVQAGTSYHDTKARVISLTGCQDNEKGFGSAVKGNLFSRCWTEHLRKKHNSPLGVLFSAIAEDVHKQRLTASSPGEQTPMLSSNVELDLTKISLTDLLRGSSQTPKPSRKPATNSPTKQSSRMAPWVMWTIIGCLVVGVVILITCIACCCCKRQAKQMQMIQYPLTPMASPRHRHRVVRTVRGPGMV